MVVGDSGCELETAEMVGVATLSANSASLFKSMVVSVEASTIQTLAGSLWKNNSRRKNCCQLLRVCHQEVAPYILVAA